MTAGLVDGDLSEAEFGPMGDREHERRQAAVRFTRRAVLRALAAVPLCGVSACVCRREYPKPLIRPPALRAASSEPILMPPRLAS